MQLGWLDLLFFDYKDWRQSLLFCVNRQSQVTSKTHK
ncbi:hypothetical protein Oscil6304_2413 [Oscillatoria acuminata PCC 6304]|uniref:Uncharacterized protein n=1 Tax=Oscillatoria acuminata PCC 6304 TaxID=56110 RepID=K9TIP8_9CYAN|nr:hypothetical protein Oscil6304_2413 [Oscillatoria acuminata PCC 6304]